MMKRTLFAIIFALFVASSVQAAYQKQVKMDDSYILIDRDKIVRSNELAVAAGDLSGDETNTVVTAVRGVSFPAPGTNDIDKLLSYDGTNYTWSQGGWSVPTTNLDMGGWGFYNWHMAYEYVTNGQEFVPEDSGKTFLMTNDSDVTVTLPTNMSAATVGMRFTVINLTTNILEIDVGDGQSIDDSDSGRGIYSGFRPDGLITDSNLWPFSSVTLERADTNWWHVLSGRGDWTSIGTNASAVPAGRLPVTEDSRIWNYPQWAVYRNQMPRDAGHTIISTNIDIGGGYSAILGGVSNFICEGFSPKVGQSTIVGGRLNYIEGGVNAIFSGVNNVVSGNGSGGHGNGGVAAIFNGWGNVITGSVFYSAILTGTGNKTFSSRACIVNGNVNVMTNVCHYSTILAGVGNLMDGTANDGSKNSVMFGTDNYMNRCEASFIGGSNNTANIADWSFVFGRNLTATSDNVVVFGDGTPYTNKGPDSFNVWYAGGINLDGPTRIRQQMMNTITNGQELTLDDSGKVFWMTNASEVIVTLPTNISASTIGMKLTFVNITTNILELDAVDGHYVEDSDLGSGIYSGFSDSNLWPYSSVTLQQGDTNWWHIVAARGDWSSMGTGASAIPVSRLPAVQGDLLWDRPEYFLTGSMVPVTPSLVVTNSTAAGLLAGVRSLVSNANCSVIVGGEDHVLKSSACGFIGAGDGNIIDNGSYCAILSGLNNSISNGAVRTTIVGGDGNFTEGFVVNCTIGGGQDNLMWEGGNALIGGCGIFSGENNEIRSLNVPNQARDSAILGGISNRVYWSDYASILGGQSCIVSNRATNSIVGGWQAIATNADCVVFCGDNIGGYGSHGQSSFSAYYTNGFWFEGGIINFGNHLIPLAADAYDVGSLTHPVRDIYSGPGSWYAGGVKVMSFDTNTSTLVFEVPAGDTNGNTYVTTETAAVGGTANSAANVTNNVVSYGTNYTATMYPTATIGTGSTSLAAIEIVDFTTSNFTYRIRDASGFVTNGGWQVIWNTAPSE